MAWNISLQALGHTTWLLPLALHHTWWFMYLWFGAPLPHPHPDDTKEPNFAAITNPVAEDGAVLRGVFMIMDAS